MRCRSTSTGATSSPKDHVIAILARPNVENLQELARMQVMLGHILPQHTLTPIDDSMYSMYFCA